jgi:hypothetical protein
MGRLFARSLPRLFIKNGMLSKSWDEILIRGRAVTPLVFALHHSIIMSIHDHVHHHLMYIAG